MTVNPSGWRPSAPANEQGETTTVTGNRALMLEEPLIFEIGSAEQTGVDFADVPQGANRLGGLERKREIGLPGLSEPETIRHYTRLSRQNYAIDLGLFALGTCTMNQYQRQID
jgi:glycine dehydrogenase subunit 2